MCLTTIISDCIHVPVHRQQRSSNNLIIELGTTNKTMTKIIIRNHDGFFTKRLNTLTSNMRRETFNSKLN